MDDDWERFVYLGEGPSGSRIVRTEHGDEVVVPHDADADTLAAILDAAPSDGGATDG